MRWRLRALVAVVLVATALALALARLPGEAHYIEAGDCPKAMPTVIDLDAGPPAWRLQEVTPAGPGMARLLVPIVLLGLIAAARPRLWKAAMWPLMSFTWMGWCTRGHDWVSRCTVEPPGFRPCETRIETLWAAGAVRLAVVAIIIALFASLTLAALTPLHREARRLLGAQPPSPPEMPRAIARRR